MSASIAATTRIARFALPALRHLHAHRRAKVQVTFASRVAKGKTKRVRRALTVLTPR